MKRIRFIFVCLFVAAIFASCKKSNQSGASSDSGTGPLINECTESEGGGKYRLVVYTDRVSGQVTVAELTKGENTFRLDYCEQQGEGSATCKIMSGDGHMAIISPNQAEVLMNGKKPGIPMECRPT
ncbi:MAG: hypothetical protein AB7T49_03945 [Oligoflexales bacterium]